MGCLDTKDKMDNEQDNQSAFLNDDIFSRFIFVLGQMDKRYEERFEAQQEALTNRVEHVNSELSALRDVIDERDRRYEERYDASQTAIQAALVSQEKQVNAALLAADRAVSKAELASEKRFEAVNEFRQTLSDQASNFATRNEVETKVNTTTIKVSDNFNQNQKDIARLSEVVINSIPRSEYMAMSKSTDDKVLSLISRLDRIEAGKIGGQEQINRVNELVPWLVASISFIGLIVSIAVVILKR